MTTENDSQAIPEPVQATRLGWAEAAKALSQANDDALVMGDFSNESDEDLA